MAKVECVEDQIRIDSDLSLFSFCDAYKQGLELIGDSGLAMMYLEIGMDNYHQAATIAAATQDLFVDIVPGQLADQWRLILVPKYQGGIRFSRVIIYSPGA